MYLRPALLGGIKPTYANGLNADLALESESSATTNGLELGCPEQWGVLVSINNMLIGGYSPYPAAQLFFGGALYFRRYIYSGESPHWDAWRKITAEAM